MTGLGSIALLVCVPLCCHRSEGGQREEQDCIVGGRHRRRCYFTEKDIYCRTQQTLCRFGAENSPQASACERATGSVSDGHSISRDMCTWRTDGYGFLASAAGSEEFRATHGDHRRSFAVELVRPNSKEKEGDFVLWRSWCLASRFDQERSEVHPQWTSCALQKAICCTRAETDQRSQQSGRNYVHRFPMGTSQNLAAQAVTYEAARRI